MKMKLRGGIGSLMVAAGMIVNSSQAVAQTSAIASGNWSDPLTWSAGEPSQTLSALVDGSFTVTVNQAGEATNLLDVGTAAGQTGNVDITGGDLTVSNVVPADFPSSIRLGQVAGSTGNLTMSAGTVAINGAVGSGFAIADALIGDNGTGTMTLTGGNFTAADEVFVALGGSSNAVIHLIAIAGRVPGLQFGLDDWDRYGREVPTLVDIMPSGRFLMEDYYYAGGLPAVMRLLGEHGLLDKDALTVTGKTMWENVKDATNWNTEVIRTFEDQWLDESIPALDGLTPREAAADPTRRDDLVRLLDGFGPAREGGMDPDRLRDALGLDG